MFGAETGRGNHYARRYGLGMAFRHPISADHRKHYLSDLSDRGREEKAGGLWAAGEELEGVGSLYSSVYGAVFPACGNLLCICG